MNQPGRTKNGRVILSEDEKLVIRVGKLQKENTHLRDQLKAKDNEITSLRNRITKQDENQIQLLNDLKASRRSSSS